MKCFRCGNETHPDTVTDVNDNGSCLIIIRNVPCEKCDFCGETFYSGITAQKLEQLTELAKSIANEISVIDYTKAA